MNLMFVWNVPILRHESVALVIKPEQETLWRNALEREGYTIELREIVQGESSGHKGDVNIVGRKYIGIDRYEKWEIATKEEGK